MPYEYKGPGVKKPHPRKGHFNPDAHPVTQVRGEPKIGAKPRGRASVADRGADRGGEGGGDIGGEVGGDVGGRSRTARSPLQLFSAAVGLVFLLIGVGGFIPGVTEMYDDLAVAGTESRAEVLGLFRVSIVHNIVHLAFGVLGLLAAAKAASAKTFLLVGGLGYLAIAAYGFVIDEESDANFLPLNDADNLLHVGLGLLMVVLALAGTAAARRR